MNVVKHKIPKSVALARILRKDIMERQYTPGDFLPPITVLTQKYKVGRTVVQCAQKILSQEGLISRERGRGTFVTDYEGGDNRIKQIALIKNNFQQAEYDYARTTICNQFGLPCTAFDFMEKQSFSALLSLAILRGRGLSGVLVDIDITSASIEEAISWGGNLPLIFFHRYEWSTVAPKNSVLLDFTASYITAARLLLGRGAKRLIFLAGHNKIPNYLSRRIKAVAAEIGMEFPSDNFIYLSHKSLSENKHSEQAEMLKSIFQKDSPPTGILGMGDYPVFQLLQLFRNCFPTRKLPDVTGMYNTEWSSQPEMSFTTFDPEWEQLWEAALERLNAPDKNITPTYISPKLIIR